MRLDLTSAEAHMKRGAAVPPGGKPFRSLTFGSLAVAESASFQWRAGPLHSVSVLRVHVFILFKVEKFLSASDIGFVMVFSRVSAKAPSQRFLWTDDNRDETAFAP